MALTPIYAKERDDGQDGFVFGLDPYGFEKVRTGYACGHCLEEFEMALPACSLCGRPTAIAGIEQVISETPQEWTDYLQYRRRELDGPARRS